jgi:hypothetical protein
MSGMGCGPVVGNGGLSRLLARRGRMRTARRRGAVDGLRRRRRRRAARRAVVVPRASAAARSLRARSSARAGFTPPFGMRLSPCGRPSSSSRRAPCCCR